MRETPNAKLATGFLTWAPGARISLALAKGEC